MKRERCADCAYTAGTLPNQYGPSKLRADLAVMTGDVFHCHHGDKPVCQGWVEERQKRGEIPQWKIDVARQMSDVFEALTDGCWVDVPE